jgi:hypothetical protein
VYPEKDKWMVKILYALVLWVPCKARWVWVHEYGREIFVIATCSLKFAKAGSAASLPQQEMNKTVDVQRGRVNTAGFMCTLAS